MVHESQQADVCIICALKEEVDAVERVICERCQVAFVTTTTDDGQFSYRLTSIANSSGEQLTLVLFCQTRPGPVSAARDVGILLEKFQPCFVGMSGICAGDKRQVHLGDLVVAEHAYHFEEGKVTQDEQGGVIHQPEGITYSPASQLLQCVRTFEAWKTPVAKLRKQVLGIDEVPQCVMAMMASGMTVRSDDPFPTLQMRHRKAWALDMEAASLYFALHAKSFVDGLVVKGVVDYADLAKDDTFHEYAACASAIYLLTFIQEYVTRNALLRRRRPAIFAVPYPRNAYFTGREELLTQLHSRFQAGTTTALSQTQAISGLGGIGKTQVAVEYAYQRRGEYEAVFWVLSDTRESLVSGYIAIAELLDLPQKNGQDQTVIVKAVKSWLQTHGSWLLIMDNADDLTVVQHFLPVTFSGHILLTTQAQGMGRLAKRIEVDTMSQDMGALFLLRRAGLVETNASLDMALSTDAARAREICDELGGLPLALDQAGAYIEEAQCSLQDYQERYRRRRAHLLQRRGGLVKDHPQGVWTTWSISFEKVEERSPVGADLLRLCAFLSPDGIPVELIVRGANSLGPHLTGVAKDEVALDEAIAILGAYSFMCRKREEKTLTLHRLVQAVLRDTMDEKARRLWAERTVQAVSQVFPAVEFTTWTQCERYLPHALVCADLVEQERISSQETARLLHRTATYLLDRVRSRVAQPLLQQALAMREQCLGLEHTDTANTVDQLAQCFELQGKYPEAESLYRRGLEIDEKRSGGDHPDTAVSLNNLANLYHKQGKYPEAEPLYRRALSIKEQQLGVEHLSTAASLNNLASLYRAQGQYEQAEPLYVRALSIREQKLGGDHPDTAASLNNLANLYHKQGKDEQAELLYRRALTIYEQQLGAEHPDMALGLNNLASLYWTHGNYEQAEPLYRRALSIREQKLGGDHPDTAASLNNLAELYRAQGQYEQGESLHRRALSIREQKLGDDHPDTAVSLNNLALLYHCQGKSKEAEALLKRALLIRGQTLGETHPQTQATQQWYVLLLQTLGRDNATSYSECCLQQEAKRLSHMLE